MDFYDKICSLPEEELETFVRKRIQRLENKSKIRDPHDTVGFEVGYNRENHQLSEEEINPRVSMRQFYCGYIRKDMKVVYGFRYNRQGIPGNEGMYYYMDDENLILDFCRFIRGKEVQDEYELFHQILVFLHQYFGFMNQKNRESIIRMIYKDKENYFDPVYNHSIKMFKHTGSALCTEFAAVAQKILSFFYIKCYFAIGREKSKVSEMGHAFNFVQFKERDTGENTCALLDFSLPVKVYDESYQIIDRHPYVGYIQKINPAFIKSFIFQGEPLYFPEYFYYFLGNKRFCMEGQEEREYSIKNILTSDMFEAKTYRR